jgi:hypothetical protein
MVSKEMNEELNKPFERDEINAVLDSIRDLKVPGPDSMPAMFYKTFWQVVGNKVTREMLNVLSSAPMPAEWNNMIIALIPKVKNPVKVTDLRPISLCNVLYKIISKVLANHLKSILSDIISPSQSAFVPERLVSNNILIAYELTHYLMNQGEGGIGYAAIKLDISKAYDQVEWPFFEAMMRRLGINGTWTQLIMKCVCTVSHKIKINGALSDQNKSEYGGLISGVKIRPAAPSVSHLLFANDSLIMIRAKLEDAMQLQSILDLYEACSEQKINKAKSAVRFSRNTGDEEKQEIKGALDIQREMMNERYLGLLVHVGRSKTEVFAYLKDRVWKRIQGWKEIFLSWAGQEVMIKANMQDHVWKRIQDDNNNNNQPFYSQASWSRLEIKLHQTKKRDKTRAKKKKRNKGW